jgi:HAD superfamily hydrolase (TIGR01509 family)
VTPAPDLLIFDCDGVLVDSEMIYCRVDSEELGTLGFTITPQDVARRFSGFGSPDMLRVIEGEMGRALPVGFVEILREKVSAAMLTELKPVPGIERLLQRLPGPRCVASNTHLEKLRWCLGHTGLLPLLDPHVFSASQVSRPKPAPDLFLHAARTMGVAPERCLVIEDSRTGVRAAVAAGMPVIGFLGGTHCWPELGDLLIGEGASGVVRSYEELAERLGH